MRSLPGGITYTWFASTGVDFTTSDTGILLTRESSATRELSCFGARCWTRTMAIPLFAGTRERSWVTASKPPADAPTATTGKTAGTERTPRPFLDRKYWGFRLGFIRSGMKLLSCFRRSEIRFGDSAPDRKGPLPGPRISEHRLALRSRG